MLIALQSILFVITSLSGAVVIGDRPNLVELAKRASPEVSAVLAKVDTAWGCAAATAHLDYVGTSMGLPVRITIWRQGAAMADIVHVGESGSPHETLVVHLFEHGNAWKIVNGKKSRLPATHSAIARTKGDPLGAMARLIEHATRISVSHGHCGGKKVTWLALHGKGHAPIQLGLYESGDIAGWVKPLGLGEGLSSFMVFGAPRTNDVFHTPGALNSWIVHETSHGAFNTETNDGASHHLDVTLKSAVYDEPVDPAVFDPKTYESSK